MHEILQHVWFVLWGVLWAVYFALDGFDFGIGTLLPFLSKSKADRAAMVEAVGPFWNGNEVWLLTAGGATFAAFPTTYALMFSYLYIPLFLVLSSLIFRGVALEFIYQKDSEAWQKGWSIAFFLGSFLPALLFGVAFANIFAGLPMDAAGHHGNLFTLLNPYGLLGGLVFVAMFLMHGANWLSFKTTGDLSERARKWASIGWLATLILAVVFLVYTYFATNIYDNYFAMPVWFIVPLLAVVSLLSVRVFIAKKAMLAAFVSSLLTIVLVVFTYIIGLYPNLIPSSLDSAYSLSIFNTSASEYTLTIMTIVAVIMVPIVIFYQFMAYKIFSHKVN